MPSYNTRQLNKQRKDGYPIPNLKRDVRRIIKDNGRPLIKEVVVYMEAKGGWLRDR